MDSSATASSTAATAPADAPAAPPTTTTTTPAAADDDDDDIPAIALPPRPSKVTKAMEVLYNRRVVRVPTLRDGRTVVTTRAANLEAFLGHVTGQVQVPQCHHCSTGSGVWMQCVVVPGLFSGSCANCHYGSEGARCSLRKLIFLSCPLVYWSTYALTNKKGQATTLLLLLPLLLPLLVCC
jgi:Protein of unknown function (DUF3716)